MIRLDALIVAEPPLEKFETLASVVVGERTSLERTSMSTEVSSAVVDASSNAAIPWSVNVYAAPANWSGTLSKDAPTTASPSPMATEVPNLLRPEFVAKSEDV